MLKKYIKVLIISVLIVSCNYEEESHTSYMGYYDEAHSKLKMKGSILNGVEDGIWEYYDKNGEIIQKGEYNKGSQIGTWEYNYPTFDTLISWSNRNNILGKFIFSLPESFQESSLDNDTSLYTAIDKNSRDVFSIKDNGNASQTDLENYYIKTKDEMSYNFNVLNSKSSLIKSDSLLFYLDEFSLQHKDSKTTLVMYNIYTLFEGKMLVLAYSCQPQDSVKGRFFIGEIFYHTTYENKRIADPFVEIKEILDR